MRTSRSNYFIILIALILVSIVWTGCRSVSARPQVSPTPHIEYGVIQSGEVSAHTSTAVEGVFSASFEEAPVCTLSQLPGTVGSLDSDKGESAAATLEVVLMNIAVDRVTFFINNGNDFPEGTSIHWHCIGQ